MPDWYFSPYNTKLSSITCHETRLKFLCLWTIENRPHYDTLIGYCQVAKVNEQYWEDLKDSDWSMSELSNCGENSVVVTWNSIGCSILGKLSIVASIKLFKLTNHVGLFILWQKFIQFNLQHCTGKYFIMIYTYLYFVTFHSKWKLLNKTERSHWWLSG